MTFKKGDKIRRKVEYLQVNDWKHGRSILIVNNDQYHDGTVYFTVNGHDSLNSIYSEYFELAKEMTIEDQITFANTLIGKKSLKSIHTSIYLDWIPVGIRIYTGNCNYEDSSGSVMEYMKTHDVCVALIDENNYKSYPVALIEPPVESVTVKLNDVYTVEVTKNSITVGCQTFPVSILEDLIKAHKQLS